MTNSRESLKILSFAIPAQLHRDLKILSAHEDRPMVELATSAIREMMARYKTKSPSAPKPAAAS
jgi:hypothetical protein